MQTLELYYGIGQIKGSAKYTHNSVTVERVYWRNKPLNIIVANLSRKGWLREDIKRRGTLIGVRLIK